jgi:hypothetical protein
MNFLLRYLMSQMACFTVQVPTYYAQEFATIIKLLLQQMGSRLRGTTMEKEHVGQQASPVDQVGAVEMQSVVGRFNPMGRVDAPANRRWVFPNPFDLPQLLDRFDELQMIIDPKGAYVKNALMAAGRQIDRNIIAALGGTAYTGQEAGTTVGFPSANQIAVNFGASANTGMTVAKLREARRLLMSYNVNLEEEEIYVAMHPTQHDNLLAEAQVISLDFNDRPVLVDGMIKRFLGMNFRFTTLMQYNSGTIRAAYAYCKSGVHLGLWQDIKTDVTQRKDLQGLPWQVYLWMMIGATRLEENRVIQILCQE